MTNLIAGALFLGFVVGAIAVAWWPTRRLQSALIVYVVAVSALAAVSQRDLWPISSWRLMIGPAPSVVGGTDDRRVQIVLRGRDGGAYRLDHRAVEPLDLGELLAWIRQYSATVDPAALQGLCSFLLERSEAARLRVRRGEQPGYFAGLLGPLAAPKHFLYPALWSEPADVPGDPFMAVEIHTEHWDLEERLRDTTAYELRPLVDCSP